MKKTKTKRITLNEFEASHLYELALEHFCVNNEWCFGCEKIKKRLEKFIGDKDVKEITKIIKKNGYCKNN